MLIDPRNKYERPVDDDLGLGGDDYDAFRDLDDEPEPDPMSVEEWHELYGEDDDDLS